MRLAAPISAFMLAFAVPAAANYQSLAPFAYLKDMSTGAVLFSQAADQQMPPASMAKMMTTHVAFDLVKQGKLKLDQKFRVRPETWEKWHGPKAGSTMFLSVNQEVSVEDLLHGIVTLSGNDACVVLAEGISGTEEAFVDLMNAEAKKLGLKGSHFTNSNGWPDDRQVVTPHDLAIIAERTIKDYPDLYKQFYAVDSFTWGQTMGGAPITQPNRNPILGKVRGADGLKTGHTEAAGFGFTGSAEQDGRRLVMVVSGLTSWDERVKESIRLMEWGFGAWDAKPILANGKVAMRAPVFLGDAPDVGITAAPGTAVSVPKAIVSGVDAKIVYDGPISAPIAKGQKIAELVLTVPGLAEQRVPLVAAEAVEKAGPFGRMMAAFRHVFGG
ncbi:D-alanyl-D-alanine carboxypeptidase family protein [Sphingosinicella microcystinivorans]|uniref:serine-type D-Ala-D-Ala carboxypeptidase n=1 Tax=Sphingosinicella microcystinivorans TaxID=335406 RepID=A0AAD1D791_SPHMI|nr:D-alanyl-D-alanine carboxypeptidase (penicillin-binding protein 5/6) [Sphingosinicella microcystinivorans]BBE35000.1 D-alanyl-D-alanine carboxypeptidase [Sphingosinicella microcystinivorans]